MSDSNSTIMVQHWLERLRAGEETAPRELLAISMKRLRQLSRKILADIPGVKRWEETDDVLQNASLRLWKALSAHHPSTPLDYFRLAALIIRRELVDLARQHFGVNGMGANLARLPAFGSAAFSGPVQQAQNDTNNPEALAQWTEFHEYIERLPDEERALFDLLWYQGLTQSEAATLLKSPERTVRRHWKTARMNLYDALLVERTDLPSEPK